jgi:hypothetical protein
VPVRFSRTSVRRGPRHRASLGSIATETRCPRYVRSSLNLRHDLAARTAAKLRWLYAWSGVQLIEQRLRLFQIERVEAFSEPAVDRSEKIAGLIRLTLIAS